MVKNPLIPRNSNNKEFVDLKKSAGILDDYAVRKDVQSKTGNFQKLYVGGDNSTNPVQIFDWTDTGATIDRGVSFRKDGVEQLYIGEVANIYTGIVNPNVNGGKILFGLTNDALTDIESAFVCNTAVAYVCATNNVEIQIPFSTTVATFAATQLIFAQSGDDATFDWGTAGELRLAYSNLSLETVGKGIDIKEGTNARMGTATLTNGSVTVSTTKVTANSRIFLTPQNRAGGSTGAVWVFGRTAGTSFDIQSSDDLDDRAIAWIIFEPA